MSSHQRLALTEREPNPLHATTFDRELFDRVAARLEGERMASMPKININWKTTLINMSFTTLATTLGVFFGLILFKLFTG